MFPYRYPPHYRVALANEAGVRQLGDDSSDRIHYYHPPSINANEVNLPEKIIQEITAAQTPRWDALKVRVPDIAVAVLCRVSPCTPPIIIIDIIRLDANPIKCGTIVY